MQRVEARPVERIRGGADMVHPRPPRRDGIVLVEPADVRDLLPQPRERVRRIQRRMDERGPLRCRARRRRPVGRAGVDDGDRLGQERQPVASDALGIEVVEQPRRGRAGEADTRAALLA